MNNKKNLWTHNFILIILLNFLVYWGFQMFPSATPPYIKSLGGSDNLLGWVNGLSTIAVLIVRPFAGKLLDKKGRKSIFIIGLIIMIISILGYKIFPYIIPILIFRFVHGIGWGFASTASNTIATDNINHSSFGEGMGYFSLSVSLALAVAPAISLSIKFSNVILLAIILNVITFIFLFQIKYKPIEKNSNIENNEKIISLKKLLCYLLL